MVLLVGYLKSSLFFLDVDLKVVLLKRFGGVAVFN